MDQESFNWGELTPLYIPEYRYNRSSRRSHSKRVRIVICFECLFARHESCSGKCPCSCRFASGLRTRTESA
jgi:hypothetical protein